MKKLTVIKQHISILNRQTVDIETKTLSFAKILTDLVRKKKKTNNCGQWWKCSRRSTHLNRACCKNEL